MYYVLVIKKGRPWPSLQKCTVHWETLVDIKHSEGTNNPWSACHQIKGRKGFKKWEVNIVKLRFENRIKVISMFLWTSNIKTNLWLEFLPTDDWQINTIACGGKGLSTAVWKTLYVCIFQYIIPLFKKFTMKIQGCMLPYQ